MRVFKISALFSLIAALFISGCSGVHYSATTDAVYNFGDLNTFQVVSDKSGKGVMRIHPDTAIQLKKSLDSKLTELGYSRGYPQPPDFTVSYRLEAQWDPNLAPDEIRQRVAFSGSHFPDADPRARNYQVLSLIVEVYSPAEHKVIWTGSAADIDYSPGGSGRQLLTAADELLNKFPPRWQ